METYSHTETINYVSNIKLKWRRIPEQIGLMAYDPITNTVYETFKNYDAKGNILLVDGESVGVYYYQNQCKNEAEKINLQNHREMFPSVWS